MMKADTILERFSEEEKTSKSLHYGDKPNLDTLIILANKARGLKSSLR
jgi:hypothetical protein